MAAASAIVGRLMDPEYTGENRCLPCTVVNVLAAFAAALAAKLALILGADATGLAVVVPDALFVLAVATIYLRGYLLPGTPRLTRRYLPPRLLDAFGKGAPPPGLTGGPSAGSAEVDADAVLADAGVLTARCNRESLALDDDVRAAVRARVDDVTDDAARRERVVDLLDAGGGPVRFEAYGDAYRAFHDGALVGTWESPQALRADLGAAGVLAERVDGWDGAAARERGRLLAGVRRRLRACPDCGDGLATDERTVRTCCSTYEVTTLTCEDCGARVFESRTAV